MITKTTLKSRGWTDSLITKFFPVPTKRQKNTLYRRGADVLLYDEEQVFAIENTEEFQAQKALAAIRSARGKTVAEKRHAETQKWAASLPPPKLPKLTKETLRKRACASYNALWAGKDGKHASIDDDDRFLDRICVNYLRHELTDYEAQLYLTAGKIGALEARSLIRGRILDAIASVYPWLADECGNQKPGGLNHA